tara:strand:+ start:549 stop:905 length:357 start_codon:yes stop_codon:yes gene_type:complete
MAHYAEVIDGTVLRVVVVSNGVTTIDGIEVEQRGVDFLDGLLPTDGTWVQTSYNSTFRHNMAGRGGTWDGTGFAHAQPHPSWTLDADYQWQPPTPYPDTDDLAAYYWDEDTTSWIEVD